MKTVNILIDTDEWFWSKASYTFQTFCRFLGCSGNIIFNQQGAEQVHIYYGEHFNSNIPINIYHNPQAVSFFEGDELYKPEQVDFAKYCVNKLPFLFSEKGEVITQREQGTVINKDIIASAFYFLSGWQERFQTGEIYEYHSSLQCKCGFTEIPFIDYYTNIIREALADIGLALPFEKKARLLLSHDLDYFDYWTREHLHSVYRYNLRTFFSRPLQAIYKLVGHFLTKQFFYRPERVIQKVLKKERQYGLKSKTFVLAKACGNDPRQDYLTNNFCVESIKEIFKDMEVWLHGTKQASTDADELQQQWERVNAIGLPVSGYRNHYLYFNYHRTFAMLESLGIEADYTLGFRENIGYRVGTSFPFQPYCLAEDRAYNIVEYPLVVMDVTLFSGETMGLSYRQAKKRVMQLLGHARETGGYVSLLWHFHNYDWVDHPWWSTLYWDVVDRGQESGDRSQENR